MNTNALSRTPLRLATTPAASRGFTLVELMIGVAVAGVLSSVALPSFEGQIQKSRRTEVLVATMDVQAAQERFRTKGVSYGSLAAIGIAARTPTGYYLLQVPAADADGYELLATAAGVQTRDTACTNMKVTVNGANIVYASGPDASVSNPATLNRRCWSL